MMGIRGNRVGGTAALGSERWRSSVWDEVTPCTVMIPGRPPRDGYLLGFGLDGLAYVAHDTVHAHRRVHSRFIRVRAVEETK